MTATSPYPRTFDNGRGQRITVRRRATDATHEWLEVENRIDPGLGPIMHLHPSQDESLTVRRGTLGYQLRGQEPREARIGDRVDFPRGVAHRFWNAGTDTLECDGTISPPLRFEEFIETLYASFARNGGRPGLFDLPYIAHEFRDDAEMVAVPAAVRRIVFPVVRAIGRALGKYRAYDGRAAQRTRSGPASA